MNSRDRFLAAMRNQIPDRVPVTPDISNYIPCKLTGLPFWEIYFERKLPFWQAYLNAADYFGIDAWIAASIGEAFLVTDSNAVHYDSRLQFDSDRQAMIRHTIIHTPKGNLTIKPIQNLVKDWEAFKLTRQEPIGLNESLIQKVRSACTERGYAFGLPLEYPGFQNWLMVTAGGVEQLAFALVDNPSILDEWFELDMANGTKAMELMLQAKPDYVLLCGSGTITTASPELAMKYAIPAIAKWTKMARQAGVATLLHSCGKSRQFIDMLVEHTDLDCINPLEIPPMGDIDLAEVKRSRGKQIALMGNLHTVEVMLQGTPAQVKRAAKEAILAAGRQGGFILSSGDQCGLNTPDDNFFAMVEAAKEYGVYDPQTGELIE
jgi:uroporphyrinogen decarboxylase